MGLGRCRQHGLAVGPDGRCVVCRRVEGSPSARPPQPAGHRAWVGALLGCGVLAGIGTVGWAVQGAGEPAPGPTAVDGIDSPGSAPSLSTDDEVERRAREVAEAQARLEAQLRAQSRAQVEAARAEQRREAQLEAERAGETAERDRQRHQRIVADRQARALFRARSEVAIAMYSTPWCGYCKRARAHMERAGIAFTEHNIDADAEAKRRARTLNPRGGVPTFDIDGQVLVGFSGKRFDAVYQQAVERRLR